VATSNPTAISTTLTDATPTQEPKFQAAMKRVLRHVQIEIVRRSDTAKGFEVQNSVQKFPDSWGKQRPKVSTQDHAIIQHLIWRIWGVDHGSDCQNSISPFGGQGEHQRDRA
jgi:hypothetical protein